MKNLSQMPYYKTSVPEELTKGKILKLLKKYNIIDYQWTNYQGKESLKFVLNLSDISKRVVDLQMPEIHAKYYGDEIEVPRDQKFRMIYFSLKGLMEASEFGILTLEDIFYSNTLVLTDNGKIAKTKQLRAKNVQFLIEQPQCSVCKEGKVIERKNKLFCLKCQEYL